MDFNIWLAFVLASTILVVIPGPSILLVLSYSLTQGRKVALATVAGVAVGDFIAMTASLLGLGALVLASATVFTVLKWVGAAYLIYLGVKLFRSAPDASLSLPLTDGAKTEHNIFLHTTLVTTLNPKSIAFFVAFVPQFLDTTRPLTLQFVILIATYVALGILNAAAYALLADGFRSKISHPKTLPWLLRIGGSALIAMGIMTAALRRP